MITEARFQALAKALAFLIKQSPLPKTVKAKSDRTALLQDLMNAQRPLRSESISPAPHQPAAAASSDSTQPDGPAPLEVRYAEPQRTTQVREGTVVGVPRQIDPNRSW